MQRVQWVGVWVCSPWLAAAVRERNIRRRYNCRRGVVSTVTPGGFGGDHRGRDVRSLTYVHWSSVQHTQTNTLSHHTASGANACTHAHFLSVRLFLHIYTPSLADGASFWEKNCVLRDTVPSVPRAHTHVSVSFEGLNIFRSDKWHWNEKNFMVCLKNGIILSSRRALLSFPEEADI